jgi:hypothetical protein
MQSCRAGLRRQRRALPSGGAELRPVLAVPDLHALSQHAGGRILRSIAIRPQPQRFPRPDSNLDRGRHDRLVEAARQEQAQLFGRVLTSGRRRGSGFGFNERMAFGVSDEARATKALRGTVDKRLTYPDSSERTKSIRLRIN